MVRVGVRVRVIIELGLGLGVVGRGASADGRITCRVRDMVRVRVMVRNVGAEGNAASNQLAIS